MLKLPGDVASLPQECGLDRAVQLQEDEVDASNAGIQSGDNPPPATSSSDEAYSARR